MGKNKQWKNHQQHSGTSDVTAPEKKPTVQTSLFPGLTSSEDNKPDISNDVSNLENASNTDTSNEEVQEGSLFEYVNDDCDAEDEYCDEEDCYCEKTDIEEVTEEEIKSVEPETTSMSFTTDTSSSDLASNITLCNVNTIQLLDNKVFVLFERNHNVVILSSVDKNDKELFNYLLTLKGKVDNFGVAVYKINGITSYNEVKSAENILLLSDYFIYNRSDLEDSVLNKLKTFLKDLVD